MKANFHPHTFYRNRHKGRRLWKTNRKRSNQPVSFEPFEERSDHEDRVRVSILRKFHADWMTFHVTRQLDFSSAEELALLFNVAML